MRRIEMGHWCPRVALALIGALAFACAGGEHPPRSEKDSAPAEAGRLSVFVVNYPLQYFAERIGGSEVDVRLPVPASEDPAYWSPIPETVSAYQAADLILLNGAGYAKWIGRVTLPEANLVDTSVALQERLIPLNEGPVHSHGPEGEHSHTGYAFTTWLDPTLAIAHARSVHDALAQNRPAGRGAFQTAFERLETDLRAVDERWTAISATLAGEPLLFSHPVYQYLNRRFELNGESVHWEPGEAPDEALWQEMEEQVARHPARWMIWETEPLPETAERLRAAGIESLVYRTNAVPPKEGDLLAAINADLDAIETALAD
jgi:zinc transport system substrate-binding protein